MATGAGKSTKKPTDISGLTSSEQLDKIQQLQQAMGQTGDEAGLRNPPGGNKNKLYVNTSKAFDINYYLLTGVVGSPDSNWTDFGYTERMMKNDIEKIDSGMKPMSEALATYRYMNVKSLSKMLGISPLFINSFYNQASNGTLDDTAKAKFSEVLKSTDYTHKGYTSLSYVKEHSTFDKYPIRLKAVIDKGTPAIVTNNHPEHEIVAGRGLKYNFTGNFKIVNEKSTATGMTQPYIEIEVRL